MRRGDAGGYRRDDKGRTDGGRDAHGGRRDCYGDSRGTEHFPDRNIDINKQIMGAQRNALQPLGPVSRPKARTEGGGAGGHVQGAVRGKHAVGVCNDGAGSQGGTDEGAGGADGSAGAQRPFLGYY